MNFLFSDSILNNITLHQSISLEQVKDSASKIGVDSFIENLPDSYQYNVKERGAMLSVGQRQLISFLRAYVSNPNILILDEATSNIDSDTEQMIQKALQYNLLPTEIRPIRISLEEYLVQEIEKGSQ